MNLSFKMIKVKSVNCQLSSDLAYVQWLSIVKMMVKLQLLKVNQSKVLPCLFNAAAKGLTRAQLRPKDNHL